MRKLVHDERAVHDSEGVVQIDPVPVSTVARTKGVVVSRRRGSGRCVERIAEFQLGRFIDDDRVAVEKHQDFVGKRSFRVCADENLVPGGIFGEVCVQDLVMVGHAQL